MFKRIIISVLMVCMVFGTIYAQNARDLVRQGQQHMSTQNYAEAIVAFEAALRLEPRNRNAETGLRDARTARAQQLFNQGQTLHQQENFLEAIEQYNAAIRSAPPGYNNLRMIQGRLSEAQRALEEQVTMAQKTHEEQAANARAEAERERTAQSRQFIQRAHEHFLASRFEDAINSYEHSINMGGLTDPEVADANRLITEAKDVQGKITSYNRVIRDADFEPLQNTDGTITVVKYRASENKAVNIGGTNKIFHFGILDLTIPSTLYGQRVTIIGEGAFQNMGLTSVIIPNTVTEIRVSAFAGNNLERVVLGTALRFIRGGTPVGRAEVIQPGAFEGNTRLTNITIPDTTTEIGARAFRDCGITTLVLGRVVQIIGESAFRNNKIAHLTIPAAVRRIHRFAFNTNNIESINIPQGVQQVWDDAFSNNPMIAVVLPATLAGLFQNSPCIGVDHEQYGPNIPSFPPTVVRVTLPANMQDRNLNGFHVSLRNFYVSQQRRPGLYVKAEGGDYIWTRQ
ncbi:MAG: leucine-rich repeat protein [Treponema sp.]|nr:leucine-rich repeat protein [Treponema sp.]